MMIRTRTFYWCKLYRSILSRSQTFGSTFYW